MERNKRKEQIINHLRGGAAIRKRTLAKDLEISIHTLSSYLSKLKREGLISYMRSKHKLRYGRTFIVFKD